MSFTGDFRKLDKLLASLTSIGSSRFVASSAKRLGELGYAMATQGASAGVAPNGRPWKPLKSGGMALVGVAADIEIQSRSRGFLLRVRPHIAVKKSGKAVDYLAVNQSGSKGWRELGGQRVSVTGSKKMTKGIKIGGQSIVRKGAQIPARRILPKRTLPKPWAARFSRELGALFLQAMRR